MTDFSARTLCAIAEAEISAHAGRRTPSTGTGLVFHRRTNDESCGRYVRVRHGEVQGLDARGPREFEGRRVEEHTRRTGVVRRHFNGMPRRRADADAKRLQYRFLRSKSRRESFRSRLGIAALAVSEETLRETRMAFQRQRESRDVDEIDTNVSCRHYSTVTVFAKLRGRSMLRPSPRAIA